MSCQNYRCSFLKFQLEIGSQIGGIGKVTEHILKDALEIKTCGDMVLKGSLLYALLTQSSAGSSISCFLVGLLLSTERFCCLLILLFIARQFFVDFFLSVGLGLGKTDTPEVRSRKSISSERTFAATGDEKLLYSKLGEYSENLCCFLSHDTCNSTIKGTMDAERLNSMKNDCVCHRLHF